MSEYLRVAELIRPKGLDGAVVARLAPGLLPGDLAGACVHVVPPPLRGVRSTVVLEAGAHAKGALLVLEGVGGQGAAQDLAGRRLLADAASLQAAALERLRSAALAEAGASHLGMEVSDIALGSIGTIVEESTATAQCLWVVSGPYGKVLVPAADELIVSIEGGVISMQLPDGLLEVNA